MDGMRARALLGVSEQADQHEVRDAFRRVARTTHPDAGGNTDTFVAVVEAFRSLANETIDLTAASSAPAPTDTPARHVRFDAYDIAPSPAKGRRSGLITHAQPSFADVLRRVMSGVFVTA